MSEVFNVRALKLQCCSKTVSYENAYTFHPVGRMQWLQNLAWWTLRHFKALKQHQETHHTLAPSQVDTTKLMDAIWHQKKWMFDFLCKKGQTLLIGAEDYALLQSELNAPKVSFSVMAEFQYRHTIFDLKVNVIPWMRGFLVMP